MLCFLRQPNQRGLSRIGFTRALHPIVERDGESLRSEAINRRMGFRARSGTVSPAPARGSLPCEPHGCWFCSTPWPGPAARLGPRPAWLGIAIRCGFQGNRTLGFAAAGARGHTCRARRRMNQETPRIFGNLALDFCHIPGSTAWALYTTAGAYERTKGDSG